jgi:hypothetical protein
MPDRLDSLAYTLARYRGRTPRLAFPGGSREAIAAWRSRARAKLVELLGGFPDATVPLEPELGGPIEREGYTRRTVLFATRPGMAAFAHLLVPDGLTGRASAVVCIPPATAAAPTTSSASGPTARIARIMMDISMTTRSSASGAATSSWRSSRSDSATAATRPRGSPGPRRAVASPPRAPR